MKRLERWNTWLKDVETTEAVASGGWISLLEEFAWHSGLLVYCSINKWPVCEVLPRFYSRNNVISAIFSKFV